MTDQTPDPVAPVLSIPCPHDNQDLTAPVAVPAFADNYLWLQPGTAGGAIAIDPGDGPAVARVLAQRGWTLRAILLTHHHDDHVGGVSHLLRTGQVPVYGAADPRIPANVRVGAGQSVAVDHRRFQVLDLAGHTRSHLGYFDAEAGRVYVGDTLFALGCGRLFEGEPAQMWSALGRLMALPEDTRIHAAHEYTQSNLRFARWLFPQDPALAAEQIRVDGLRASGQPTLPTLLAHELALNPFLRMRETRWRQALAHLGVVDEPVAAFARVRQLKDQFR